MSNFSTIVTWTSESNDTMLVGVSLMDMVLTTLAVIVGMALLSCLCCLCMKFSDMKMRSYIIETAKKKGVNVDLDKLNPKHTHQSPLAEENCTIMVPDVGIIL